MAIPTTGAVSALDIKNQWVNDVDVDYPRNSGAVSMADPLIRGMVDPSETPTSEVSYGDFRGKGVSKISQLTFTPRSYCYNAPTYVGGSDTHHTLFYYGISTTMTCGGTHIKSGKMRDVDPYAIQYVYKTQDGNSTAPAPSKEVRIQVDFSSGLGSSYFKNQFWLTSNRSFTRWMPYTDLDYTWVGAYNVDIWALKRGDQVSIADQMIADTDNPITIYTEWT
jgi:hypothetical protein